MEFNFTEIITTFIATLPATIAAVAALIVSIRNGSKVEEVRHATNSMKDQLVAAALREGTSAGHAAGVVEGRANQIEKQQETERKQ